jgi:hypothetical protein
LPDDLFQFGKPLGRRGLFQLVADEVFRDGKVDSAENELLGTLARCLGLDNEAARAIAEVSRKKIAEGVLDDARPMDRERLYAQILRYVHSDGTVDDKERILLEGMHKLLSIGDEVHARLCAPIATAPRAAGSARPPPEILARLEEATALLRDSGDSAPGPQAAGRAVAILDEVRASPALSPVEQTGWLGVLANLSPLLARAGKVSELEAALAHVVVRARLTDDGVTALAAALTNMLKARLADAPIELLPSIVRIAERLVRLDPPDPGRWAPLAEMAHEGLRAAATVRRFALARKMVHMLDGIPEPDERATGHRAEALLSWAVLAMKAGDCQEIQEAGAALSALAGRAPHRGVVEAHATHLGCAVEWWASQAREPGPALAALDDLHRLLTSFDITPPVARSFSLCSEFALLTLLILRDRPRVDEHLARVKDVASRVADDEDVLFAFARALVNSAIQRMDDARARSDPADPILAALAATMEHLIALAPTSAKIADARGRFERSTRRNLSADPGPAGGPAPRPALPPPHPDILRLRDSFARLQASPADGRAIDGILSVVGRGGYPARVLAEGEAVYAKDEPYFLHLLIELEAQIRSDRIGYWKANAAQLELVTRYMIEDATPAIADAARSFRRAIGLPDNV